MTAFINFTTVLLTNFYFSPEEIYLGGSVTFFTAEDFKSLKCDRLPF
jgi:hypothetical protein